MKNCIVLLLSLLSFTLLSQSEELNQKISVNEDMGYTLHLAVGLSSYEGDLHCFEDENLGMLSNSKLAFGLGVSKKLTKAVSLGLNYRMISLEGSDADFAEQSHLRRGFSFNNTIHEINARVDYEPFVNKGWKLRPYIYGGIGAALGIPEVDYNKDGLPNNDLITQINEDEAQSGGASVVAPLGFGVKTKISTRMCKIVL